MKKSLLVSLLLIIAVSCTTDREIHQPTVTLDPNSVLVYYWNFNSLLGTVTEVSPDYSLSAASAQITYPGEGAGYMDAFDPAYPDNARNGDVAGSGLRARNPSNTRSLIFDLPTTGYKKIVVQFAAARSGSGATSQIYTYTLDGTSYTNAGLSVNTFNPAEDPSINIVTLDFSNISGANDNADFKLKIDFDGATAAGASGNNRFDNVTLEAVPLAGNHPVEPTTQTFYYWNFNALAGTLTSVGPDASLVAGNTASITYAGSSAGYMDSFSPATTLNAQNGDADGMGLRVRNPSNSRSLVIAAPTTGFKNVIVKFATAKSSVSGASTQKYSYSIDGVNYLTAQLATTTFNPNIDPVYDIVALDFTPIAQANNNPNFKIRIEFAGAEAAGTSGNNRFDNFTFQGNPL
jgi:hypothetical protein